MAKIYYSADNSWLIGVTDRVKATGWCSFPPVRTTWYSSGTSNRMAESRCNDPARHRLRNGIRRAIPLPEHLQEKQRVGLSAMAIRPAIGRRAIGLHRKREQFATCLRSPMEKRREGHVHLDVHGQRIGCGDLGPVPVPQDSFRSDLIRASVVRRLNCSAHHRSSLPVRMTHRIAGSRGCHPRGREPQSRNERRPHDRAGPRSPFLPLTRAAAEPGTHFTRKQRRLLPCRKMPALVDFVEVDQVVITALGPAARRL